MKKLVVILGIATVVASGIALSFWRQLDANRQQIADLQASLQQAQTAQQNAEAALARQAQAIALRPEATAAPAGNSAPVAAPPAVSATVSALADELRQRMTDPQGKDIRRAQRRMLLPQRYPNVGKWLNLTPDQESQLFDMLARHEIDQSDAILDPANRNNPAAQQEAARNLAAQRQANDAELSTLLGSKYPQFQEYQQTMPVHRQVSQLQAMVGSGADGLTDAQARSLTTALVAEQLRINQERSSTAQAAPVRNVQDMLQQQQERTAENNRRLLQVAGSQLNAQQLESYRRLIQDQERTSSALSRSLREAEAAAAAARPATGQ